MRLFEIECPKLFLGLSAPQKVGATVSLDCCSPCLVEPAIEDRLEAKRPVGCISRKTSMPLQAGADGSDFIYRVEPIDWGCYHSGWLRLMREMDPGQSGTLDSYATRYWAGIACPEFRTEPWEYWASKVKIGQQTSDPRKTEETLDRILSGPRWEPKRPKPSDLFVAQAS